MDRSKRSALMLGAGVVLIVGALGYWAWQSAFSSADVLEQREQERAKNLEKLRGSAETRQDEAQP